MRSPRRLLGALAEDVLSRADAQAIIERAVRLSQADEIQVNVGGGTQTNVRFADNRMSTAGSVSNVTLTIQSSYGKRSAAVQVNDASDAALERAVRQSEALARLAPENPEAMPPLGAQQYAEVPAWFEGTANLSAAERAAAARVAIEAARESGDLQAAGFIQVAASATALGNKRGLFAYHRGTSANYTLTVRTADGTGSGWAGADHPDWSRIDPARVAETAIQKARLSRNPSAVEPGRYTVILEPQAVGDLVQLLGFALDARSADEGRSAFSKAGGGNKIGEKIVDERVTIVSDPRDPDLLAQPFDGQGLPLGRQVWIENGVLKNLAYSRFWAQRRTVQPTGFPSSMKMVGGSSDLDQMVASTPRGILVTRLWYLRQVDPRTILFTGLTRDGTFLIENGKLSRSIRNLRFNESPLFLLNNVELIGRAQRLAGTEAGGNVVLPALKVRDFNFTSLSEAV
ncbi:MAG TPA: TldD/PmbA family protein [Gemmatimonadaceae bacterium]|nr:TldD/PmbA family protein [Gemmatimonadaceae bacterium]